MLVETDDDVDRARGRRPRQARLHLADDAVGRRDPRDHHPAARALPEHHRAAHRRHLLRHDEPPGGGQAARAALRPRARHRLAQLVELQPPRRGRARARRRLVPDRQRGAGRGGVARGRARRSASPRARAPPRSSSSASSQSFRDRGTDATSRSSRSSRRTCASCSPRRSARRSRRAPSRAGGALSHARSSASCSPSRGGRRSGLHGRAVQAQRRARRAHAVELEHRLAGPGARRARTPRATSLTGPAGTPAAFSRCGPGVRGVGRERRLELGRQLLAVRDPLGVRREARVARRAPAGPGRRRAARRSRRCRPPARGRGRRRGTSRTARSTDAGCPTASGTDAGVEERRAEVQQRRRARCPSATPRRAARRRSRRAPAAPRASRSSRRAR